jgi:hypothetical protein
MDRAHMEEMLVDLRRERAEAEGQLVILQRRVDSLRKAAEGMEELLVSDPDLPDESVQRVTEPSYPTSRQGTVGPKIKEPSGGSAATAVLSSDPTRFWTVREVWEEQVKRGWAPDTKDGRAAVRVALSRLQRRDPRVDRAEGPTPSYRWNPQLTQNNGFVAEES